MKTIQYRVVFAEGNDHFITVNAEDINQGMLLALAEMVAVPSAPELARIEFWMVRG